MRPSRSARPPLHDGTRAWCSVAVAAYAALIVGALLAGWAGYAAGSPDPVQAEVQRLQAQRLQAQDAARDKAQTKELTATAREGRRLHAPAAGA